MLFVPITSNMTPQKLHRTSTPQPFLYRIYNYRYICADLDVSILMPH